MPSAPQSTPPSMLAGLTSELDKLAPRFDIEASQIHVLRSPADFYRYLIEKILAARRRIFLSTLYIGTTEYDLINAIRKSLKAHPELTVTFLVDALRGTRETPEPSCASLLAPLVTEFGSDRVDVRLYHTPNLTGLRKKFVPKRINEGWGLQHMKLYGIDDEIILSGANLSSNYFTNRQDRYHAFSSKELTNYYFAIHSAISSISFQILPDSSTPAGYTLTWPSSNEGPSPLISPAAYKRTATSLLARLIRPQTVPSSSSQSSTQVYPLSQLTPLLSPDTSTELPALTTLLSALTSPPLQASSWMFTAGYFNIHPRLSRLLLSSPNSTTGTVITAAPQANGFYGSAGVSGMLPAAYTLLARRFLDDVKSAGREESVKLREWRRGVVGEKDGWTYHAKGLWVGSSRSNPEQDAIEPCVTLVGSSNYTKRSYELDLEVGALVVTSDPGLKKRLGKEQEWLREYSKEVNHDEFERVERRVSWKVRVAMLIVRLVGGAL
ncbi:MAG: CDP-diacylglycerol--glycerol-3-phosphate 3-phosphatidyltransferase [Vezdaea aestivalis]|nr:MAG: CDP-diacylglycerol--glycerol-3-phosphate 3-phosphatidyltransferase [Vezdaea aestivalis]